MMKVKNPQGVQPYRHFNKQKTGSLVQLIGNEVFEKCFEELQKLGSLKIDLLSHDNMALGLVLMTVLYNTDDLADVIVQYFCDATSWTTKEDVRDERSKIRKWITSTKAALTKGYDAASTAKHFRE